MSSIPEHSRIDTDPAQIRQMLTALVPGVYEIRITDPRKPRFWSAQAMYLQLPEDLEIGVQRIASVRGTDAAAVYLVGNPLNPALLGRGRANFYNAKSTAGDDDVLHRHLLYLDIDADRPSAINAEGAEIAAVMQTTTAVVEWLTDVWDFPQPLFHGTSGSGGMVLYRIDLPNDEAARGLVEHILATVSAEFSDDRAHVDRKVFNAARIFRVPGTVNAKSNTPQPDRPWTLVTGTWTDGEVIRG